MTKAFMDKPLNIILVEIIDSFNHNIFVYFRVEFDNLNLNIVQIVLSLIGWLPITTLRFHKITIFKRFRCNLLETNIAFKWIQLYGIGKVTYIVINWSYRIYNGVVSKGHKIIPSTWEYTMLPLANFELSWVGTDIEKCYIQFVTPTLYIPYLWNNTVETL